MNKFMLTDQDYQILKLILKPYPGPVYVYGSRAKGVAQRFSDIDLYIDFPISNLDLTYLITQCEESNLSIKVDIHTQLSEDFLRQIRKDFIRFS